MLHIDPEPELSQASRSERALVEGLASYLKETTIYPDSNIRVRQKLDDLIAAAGDVRRDSPRIRIRVSSEGFNIGNSRIESDGPRLCWLTERLTATALGVIEIDENLTNETFRAFAEQLKEVYPRRHQATTFEMMWPKTIDGLKLLPRRYSSQLGTDTDDTETAKNVESADDGDRDGKKSLFELATERDRAIAELLESSESILEQARRIETILRERHFEHAEAQMLSLLGHIVHALPADAVDDAYTAVGYVEGVLGSIESAIDREESIDSPSGDLRLQSLMLQLTRSFFGSLTNTEEGKAARERAEAAAKAAAAAEETNPTVPRLRPEDEKIVADLPLLLAEIDGLPDADGALLDAATFMVPAERTGILLHQIVNLDDEESLALETVRMEVLIPDLDPEELALLGCYLRAYFDAESGKARRLRRVFELVMRADDLNLVRRSGALTVASAARYFPRYFRLFLDSMNLEDEQEVETIHQLCAELGPRRIYRAAGELTNADRGVLTPALFERILIVPNRSLIPMVHLALELCGDSLKELSAEFLKEINLEAKEAQPLWILDSPRSLPIEFLSGICKAEITGKYSSELADQAATAIREFIRSYDHEDPRGVARCCYAITQLARFPSEETKALLHELLRAKGFLGLSKSPRPIRQAARTTLDSMP